MWRWQIWLRWGLIGLLLSGILGVGVALAQASDPPPALTVEIHDSAGRPISGVLVQVTDATGSRVFGQAATDASGQARIATLPTGDVRVRIEGHWQSIALTQSGADRAGVRMIGDLPLRLDLRVAPDGQVVPDPATMIAPEPAGPLVAIPTAPVARMPTGSAALPRWPDLTTPVRPAGAEAVATDSPVSEAPSGSPDLPLIGLLAVGALAGAGLLLVALRWGRPV